MDEKLINEIVARVIRELQAQEFVKHTDASGVMSIKTSTVKPEPFDTGNPGDRVFLKDVVSNKESRNMGAGVMEIRQTTFDWFLDYDEFDFVIEGTLSIIIDGRKVTGNAGDILYIPKGSHISFSAEDFARFAYFTYPVDWQ